MHDPRYAPIGVYRSISRPSVDRRFRAELAAAREGNSSGLQQLLLGPIPPE
ncbi:MAG: hypothetical protein PHQ28_11710 [Mycobacterium sp.]|nr:hypothetical protein [Mycobacterium sp.]